MSSFFVHRQLYMAVLQEEKAAAPYLDNLRCFACIPSKWAQWNLVHVPSESPRQSTRLCLQCSFAWASTKSSSCTYTRDDHLAYINRSPKYIAIWGWISWASCFCRPDPLPSLRLILKTSRGLEARCCYPASPPLPPHVCVLFLRHSKP